MSELSRKARKDSRARAQRMAGGNDPRRKVDASTWTPPEPLNAHVKTGARPVRARIYKAGGRVQGDRARRADRLPRDIANAQSTRNTVKANKEEFGSAHEGGFKKGGRTKRDMGGAAGAPVGVDPRLSAVPDARMAFRPTGTKMFGMKAGGKAKGANYLGGTRPAGGRVAKADGGPSYSKTAVDKEIRKDKRIGGKEAAQINRLLKGRQQYDEPPAGAGKNFFNKPWPADDGEPPEFGARGTNADDRRSLRGLIGGNRASGGKATKCGGGRAMRADGGRTKKGKTNINITIGQPGGQQQMMPPPPGVVRPPPVPPQMPMGGPGMPPPGLAGPGMPPPSMAGGPPPGPPGGPPPPMPRARGGRTSASMSAGALSGEGRLQKKDIQRSNRKAGGKVYRSGKDMDAGALSGRGRLEKSEIQARNR